MVKRVAWAPPAGWLFGALFLLAGAVQAEPPSPAAEPVRPAQVAGQFYPEEPATLRSLVQGLLVAQPKAALRTKPRVLIAPHAGYPYSGPVAAKAFRQLQGAQYDAVVVVGFTHQVGFSGASVDEREAYETPLGRIPVDIEAAASLRTAHPRLAYRAEAHTSGEHSLEVMLPFLQVALGEFRLVPVLMGNATLQDAEILAEALATLSAQGDYLFVFSTDLSHYHPYGEARVIDERTLKAILRETPQAAHRLFEEKQLEACGRGPIVASLLLAAKLGYLERVLVGYANSGDTTGDRARVVGYGAIAMVERAQETADGLSAEAGGAMVSAVRSLLRLYFQPGFDRRDISLGLERYPELTRSTGLFVTLRKRGQLRGCIGRIHGVGPLAQVLPTVALDAALRDPRFRPVSAEELDELEVEVSVLSPPKTLERLEDLVPGRDGVILEAPGGHGVFLPQVWDETGWTREEFLSELASQKAGLAPDAWKTAMLSTFQDQIFTEQK